MSPTISPPSLPHRFVTRGMRRVQTLRKLRDLRVSPFATPALNGGRKGRLRQSAKTPRWNKRHRPPLSFSSVFLRIPRSPGFPSPLAPPGPQAQFLQRPASNRNRSLAGADSLSSPRCFDTNYMKSDMGMGLRED